MKVNGSTISQPGEVAEILANEYSQRSNGVSADESFNVHKKMEEKNMISFPHTEPRKIYNKPFVMEELLFALEKSSSKAPGRDNIPTIFIKEVPLIKLTKLLGFYNFIWENGFPHQW